jgi:hypothetical protein
VRRRGLVRILLVLVAIPVLGLGLFALNGAVLAPRNKPVMGATAHRAAEPPASGSTVRIFEWNIAKLFIHKGGLSFERPEIVRARLQRMAAIINAEHPDMVFLEEGVFECALCPVNQVVELAEATGMPFWVFGENYDLGVPFFPHLGRQRRSVPVAARAGRQSGPAGREAVLGVDEQPEDALVLVPCWKRACARRRRARGFIFAGGGREAPGSYPADHRRPARHPRRGLQRRAA